MTPQEFRNARQSLGLSQSELGRMLGVNPRTVRKWEHDNGTRPPNPIACRVLLWMLNGIEPTDTKSA